MIFYNMTLKCFLRWTLILLVFETAYFSNGAETVDKGRKYQYCEGLPESLPLSQFATKTAYAAASKPSEAQERYDEETSACTPVSLWHLGRHGTRYPSVGVARALAAGLPGVARDLVVAHRHSRGCLTDEEAKNLEDWSIPFSPRDAAQLHVVGGDEQEKLGEQLLQDFSELFAGGWSTGRYEIEVTSANRTLQSAQYFLRGLFGDAAAGIEVRRGKAVNWKLRAYDSCQRWQTEVRRNPETVAEASLYRETLEFRRMLRQVSKRLGYLETKNADEIFLIYEECRFESAWTPSVNSAWCAGFTQHDLSILEHYENLRYYYIDGAGAPEEWRMLPCQALLDLREKFSSAIYGSSPTKAALYFSHDHHILQLYRLLKLHQPVSPPTHLHRPTASQFNVSSISPFSSNLAFVLFKCDGHSYRVGARNQGGALSLAHLCDGVTCPWPLPLLQGLGECAPRAWCDPRDEL